MEAVIFVGGVSLGQPATSIPLAAIVGIICGLIVGFLIYTFASRTTLTVFLIAMTNLLLLIGAGLFSRAVGAFERNSFNRLLGADVDDAGGSGPGSYRVQGNVWHLDCCDPENNLDSQGWSVFNALFGWSNNGSSQLCFIRFLLAWAHQLSWNSWDHFGICILLARGRRRSCILQIQRGALAVDVLFYIRS